MYDTPVLVQHNVAVVPVFDLQEETDDAVGCHALDEVAASKLVLGTVLVSVDAVEVLVETSVCRSSELVSGLGVRNAFYDAALQWSKGL